MKKIANLSSSSTEEPIPNTTVIISCFVIVITLLFAYYLDQKTAKGPFGLHVNLPVAHLYTTHGGKQM